MKIEKKLCAIQDFLLEDLEAFEDIFKDCNISESDLKPPGAATMAVGRGAESVCLLRHCQIWRNFLSLPQFSNFWNPGVNFHLSDRNIKQNEAFHGMFDTFETKNTWKSLQFDADEVLRTIQKYVRKNLNFRSKDILDQISDK